MGRPKALIKRVKTNFFIREDIAEWLKTNRPPGAHIETVGMMAEHNIDYLNEAYDNALRILKYRRDYNGNI